MRAILLSLPIVLAAVLACGCPRSGYPAPEPTPEVAEVLARLQTIRDSARSYRSDSLMEYWVKKERVKADVPVIGKRGARVRFLALSPAGGSTLADLACDGTNFAMVDYQNNCYLDGPCTKDSIKHLLRISLEPDDFLLMAMGTTPVIPDPDGTVKWDSKNGRWVVELVSADNQWTQTILLNGRSAHRDVVQSTVRDARGNIEWKLTNKDFKTYKGADGTSFRLPGRSRLEQPKEKGDLTVRWFEERNEMKREVNLELPHESFVLEPPAGLARCGQQPPRNSRKKP